MSRREILEKVTNTRRLELGQWAIKNQDAIRMSLRKNNQIQLESNFIDLIMGWARALAEEVREEELRESVK